MLCEAGVWECASSDVLGGSLGTCKYIVMQAWQCASSDV